MNLYSTNTFSSIVNCVFISLSSSNAGGAIYIYNANYQVDLQFTHFHLCSSTGYVFPITSGRKNQASGGCLFVDVKNINISNVYTTECHTNYYGHSLFCTIPLNTESHIQCISDYLSGSSTLIDYSTIHVFDLGSYFLENVNVTYPKQLKYPGAIHIGMTPKYSSIIFLNIVFQENKECTALAFSLQDSGYNIAEYGHIERSSENNKGIIGFISGTNMIKHFDFIQCTGNLVYVEVQTQAITFENCYFSTSVNLNTNNAIIKSSLSQTNKIPMITLCKFEINSIVMSCYKHAFNKYNFFNVALYSIYFITNV